MFKQHSIANSAGLIAYPATRRDWVRPGIMLYGVSPFDDSTVHRAKGLLPVMTFHGPHHRGQPLQRR